MTHMYQHAWTASPATERLQYRGRDLFLLRTPILHCIFTYKLLLQLMLTKYRSELLKTVCSALYIQKCERTEGSSSHLYLLEVWLDCWCHLHTDGFGFLPA